MRDFFGLICEFVIIDIRIDFIVVYECLCWCVCVDVFLSDYGEVLNFVLKMFYVNLVVKFFIFFFYFKEIKIRK